MATDLVVFGPYEILFSTNGGRSKQLTKAGVEAFLRELEELQIYSKKGCYVFAMRAGHGYCPWYVGMSSNSLGAECLGTYQINLYNEFLFQGTKGTPVMFFIAPDGNETRVPALVCHELETTLIQSAHAENPSLLNTRKKRIADWTVKGVIRSGKGKRAGNATAFKKMMGL